MDIFDDSQNAQALKTLYEDNNCKDFFKGARHVSAELTEECKKILKSISMFTLNGGTRKECECDQTGSESSQCDEYTGQCKCKKNVVGRTCKRCAPGFYGFGQDGCSRKLKFNSTCYLEGDAHKMRLS